MTKEQVVVHEEARRAKHTARERVVGRGFQLFLVSRIGRQRADRRRIKAVRGAQLRHLSHVAEVNRVRLTPCGLEQRRDEPALLRRVGHARRGPQHAQRIHGEGGVKMHGNADMRGAALQVTVQIFALRRHGARRPVAGALHHAAQEHRPEAQLGARARLDAQRHRQRQPGRRAGIIEEKLEEFCHPGAPTFCFGTYDKLR